METITLAPAGPEWAVCALVVLSLALMTGAVWHSRARGAPLLLALLLDGWTLGLLIPDFLSQRVVLEPSALSLSAGRWYQPHHIRVDLSAVDAVYEVYRPARWLQRDRYWVFQHHNFHRTRIWLPLLANLRRGELTQWLASRDIQVRPAPDLEAAARRLKRRGDQ
ncbi:MAG: hypothetical protein AAGA23_21770 [Pseudomonadota bacterium]